MGKILELDLLYIVTRVKCWPFMNESSKLGKRYNLMNLMILAVTGIYV